MTAAWTYSVAAAGLLAAAQYVHGAFAWGVCAALVIAAGRSRGTLHAALLGAAFGVLATSAHVPWVASALARYFGYGLVPSALATFALAVVAGGGLGAALGLALRGAVTAPGLWPLPLVGAVWVTLEWTTTALIPHYPWAPLAASQADLPTVLPVTALLGQGGLSFAIATAGACFGAAWLRFDTPLGAPGLVLAGLLVVSGCCMAGWLIRSSLAPVPESCTLLAVDAGVARAQQRDADLVQRHVAATGPLRRAAYDAVIWPESALPASPESDVQVLRRLRELAREAQTVLIAGGPRLRWDRDWRAQAYNSAYRIDARRTLAWYDKRVPVPFTEYWPLPALARPAWMAGQGTARGERAAVFAAGACRLGVLICFEAQIPRLAREAVQAGANVLLVLSNDAYLPEKALQLQMTQSRMRAAENGVPLLRVANLGVSALVDRSGQVLDLSRRGPLEVRVAAGEPAPAVHLAVPFLRLCAVLSAVALLSCLRGQRPSRPGT